MRLPQNLDFTKPKVDQYLRANDSLMKTIGVTGLITITTAVIKLLQIYVDNKHEVELANLEHEERMLELEIEKMKITNDANNE